MTTKRKVREWFGKALEELIETSRALNNTDDEDDAAAVGDVRNAIRNIELVEKVTGQSVYSALPQKREPDA